jgi:hypothetical protein
MGWRGNLMQLLWILSSAVEEPFRLPLKHCRGRSIRLVSNLQLWKMTFAVQKKLPKKLQSISMEGLYRSLGSIDVVAAARSVLQVERDQEDTDIRIVRQIKNSLAPSDGEIRFSITAEMGFQWLECKSTFVSSEQPEVPEFESKTEKAAFVLC